MLIEATEATPQAPKRRSRAWPAELLAMKHFCKAMETAAEDARFAAIQYLVMRYYGNDKADAFARLCGRR